MGELTRVLEQRGAATATDTGRCHREAGKAKHLHARAAGELAREGRECGRQRPQRRSGERAGDEQRRLRAGTHGAERGSAVCGGVGGGPQRKERHLRQRVAVTKRATLGAVVAHVERDAAQIGVAWEELRSATQCKERRRHACRWHARLVAQHALLQLLRHLEPVGVLACLCRRVRRLCRCREARQLLRAQRRLELRQREPCRNKRPRASVGGVGGVRARRRRRRRRRRSCGARAVETR